MGLPADYLETYPKLRRLLEQVEARQLHVQVHEPAQSPGAWLAQWLSTPLDDLNGRQPSHFLAYADYDLKRPGFRGGSNTGEWSHEEVRKIFA